jgi:site-specific DNA-adenine methylase
MEDLIMTTTLERSTEHIGETAGLANCEHDLVHELSKRLDCLWRCDQYIANAEDNKKLVDFWKKVKRQEQQTIDELRMLIREEVAQDRF